MGLLSNSLQRGSSIWDDMLIVVERQEYGHKEVEKTERVKFYKWREKKEVTALCIVGKPL